MGGRAYLNLSRDSSDVRIDFGTALLHTSPSTHINHTKFPSVMIIPPVTLDSTHNARFYTVLYQPDNDTVRVRVYGFYESLMRILQVDYGFGQRANTVFNFGVATKGPLSLQGNILIDGANLSIESNAYIESLGSMLALEIIGNSQIGGSVQIGNPVAIVDLQGGKAGIGGETGQDAIDNHVERGVPLAEFPEPDPSMFISYATAANNIIDSDTDTSADMVLENITIEPGTNPSFSGHSTLKGVVYIKQPNVVTFTGGVNITGVIVTDGSFEDNSGANQLIFRGNVDSYPMSELPDAEDQFEGLHDKTGSFIIAPGFATSFGGSFSTLSGAIASNGVTFFGNAGGTIRGSVINYSEETMSLSGNSDLFFNRSGLDNLPPGFVPQTVLQSDPTTYLEPMLPQFALNN